jgi:hypothetical protein
MVRGSAIREIGGYDGDPAFRYSEAYDPFSRLAMRFRMANLPDKLLLWRRHPDATSIQHTLAQSRSGEVISLRNISMLADQTQDGVRHNSKRYLLSGFNAFTSTPAGQLPALPAEQILSAVDFFCLLRETFYRFHRFPRSAVARHRRSLNWTWGKHAIGLAVRAPWDWRARIRSFILGVRRLWHAAWATLVSKMDRSVGRGSPALGVTVPTIQPFPKVPEQEH